MRFDLSNHPNDRTTTSSRPNLSIAAVVAAVFAALALSLLTGPPASAAVSSQPAAKHKIHLVAKKGERGKQIRVLQRRLDFKSVNGYYGNRTVKAVKKWQRKYDRPVTGRVYSPMWHRLKKQHARDERRERRQERRSKLNWDALARCEAGGNWHINTGNGYYGGLQFSASTWHSVGGRGLPHQNSKAEQIKRGEKLYKRSGTSPWPACGHLLHS